MKQNNLTYLNPTFCRNNYILLNGIWDLKIVEDRVEKEIYSGPVVVPYALEFKESGVNRKLTKDETAIYSLTLPKIKVNNDEEVILHFLAVDQDAIVKINGIIVTTHVGGYTPFECNISPYLKEADNILEVYVKDYTQQGIFSYGKQKEKRGGIWYTPTSGIVQDVYLEVVKKQRVADLQITPLYDLQGIDISVAVNGESSTYKLLIEGEVVECKANEKIFYKVKEFHPWSPKDPYLYNIEIQYQDDIVKSYFGLRKIEVKKDKEYSRIYLNNKPIFLSGVLDQGYYSVGYTVKDIKEYENDILLLKSMGFNTVRKHIKLEHPYFYYLCDKYGLVVIQDMINGGSKYKFRVITVPAMLPIKYNDHKYKNFGRTIKEGRDFYFKEAGEILKTLYNNPSVLIYTVFNEGWGQFDSVEVTKRLKNLDSTRLYDSTSGWHDFGSGNFQSKHVYFKKFKPKLDKTDRALLLSEFGGYGLKVDGHTFTTAYFCYKKTKDKNKLQEAIIKLYEKEVIPSIQKGLCGTIYTQLADVEDELNGLITYDREVLKVDTKEMLEINNSMYKEMEK